MVDPDTEVDRELAALAAEKAKSRGEDLDDLIEQWLRAYLADESDVGRPH